MGNEVTHVKFIKEEKTIKCENTKKNYFNLDEIKEFNERMKENDFLYRKKYYEENIRKVENEDKMELREKYIEIIKLLICDNTNKSILKIYLNFIKENNLNIIQKDLPTFKEEIEYYKVCLTQEDLKNNFEYIKERSEKLRLQRERFKGNNK